MEICHRRHWYTDVSTIGECFVDGETVRSGFILEDKVRPAGVKVYGATAIPAGRYRVVIDRSERFSQRASEKAGHPVDVFLMRLLNVPMFTGIRVHGGNDAEDTEGCLLYGTGRATDQIWGGRIALPGFQARVQSAIGRGEDVWWSITDEPLEDPRSAA